MPQVPTIALIGDFDPDVIAHQAIPPALALAAESLGSPIQHRWLPTDRIGAIADLEPFAGFWCVPASPYRSAEGALTAIRFARERERPFLGTCGGFQHAVIEYARHELGWADADHAETNPDGLRSVVAGLACSLVEVADTIRFAPDSIVGRAYGQPTAREEYHCRFGLNPRFAEELTSGPLRPTAWDDAGDIRAVELTNHPFFVGTLFQPERAALRGVVPPLARALVSAVLPGAPNAESRGSSPVPARP